MKERRYSSKAMVASYLLGICTVVLIVIIMWPMLPANIETVEDGVIVDGNTYMNYSAHYRDSERNKYIMMNACFKYFAEYINEKYGDSTEVHIDKLFEIEKELQNKSLNK